jgi:ferredoxin-nitrite reductase
MGDGPFRQALHAVFDAKRHSGSWPQITGLTEPARGLDARAVLTFANGDVSPEAAEVLAALAERSDAAVCIGLHHRVMVFGPDDASLQSDLASAPALAGAARPQPSVVACPGARWCRRGLARTDLLADRIRRVAAGALEAGATVCVSGCPNGCAHSRVADVGLVGGRVRGDGESQEAWDLYTGGGLGRTPALAEDAGRRLSADEVLRRLGG